MARPASDIASRLVLAARERFLEEGVDGASLRAIARDAGTSLGMVYYYFPAKDDLFFAVIEDVYAELVGRIEKVLTGSLRAEDKVRSLYQIFAALTDDDIKVVRLIVKEGLASSQRLSRLFERFSRGHVPLLIGMLVNGAHAGELRGDLPPMVLAVCTLAIGLLPQVVARRLEEAGPPLHGLLPPPEALAAALAEVALRGLEARPRHESSASREPGSESQRKPR